MWKAEQREYRITKANGANIVLGKQNSPNIVSREVNGANIVSGKQNSANIVSREVNGANIVSS